MDSQQISTAYDVYLSGPMTGLPNFNRPAFAEAASMVRRCGLSAFNPGEADLENVRDWKANMRICIAALAISHRLVQLEGWQQSKGAMIEHDLAKGLQIECIDWEIFSRHLQRIPQHQYGSNLYQI